MIIFATFSNSDGPKTGLSPTIDIYGSSGSQIVSNGKMSEVADGFYKYPFNDLDSVDYVFRADGGSSLIAGDRYCYGTNELPRNKGGGGLALRQEMVFSLKRLSDNMATAKDMKKFIKELTSIISKEQDKRSKENQEDKVDTMSKMSQEMDAKMEMLISLVQKDERIKGVASVLKKSSQQILNKVKENKQEIENAQETNKLLTETIKGCTRSLKEAILIRKNK